MNKELRTFKLIDKEGFLRASAQNSRLVRYHMNNGCFIGKINHKGRLVSLTSNTTLIATKEMQYFEEVTLAEPQTPSKTFSQPLQATFSDETIH